jgi:hypothetical protein
MEWLELRGLTADIDEDSLELAVNEYQEWQGFEAATVP